MGKDRMPKDKRQDGHVEEDDQIVGMSNSEEESEELEASSVEQEQAEIESPEESEIESVSEETVEEVIDQIPFAMADKDFVEDSEEIQNEIFVENDELLSVIESLLFATDKPLSVNQMFHVFAGTNIKRKHIRKALEEYQSILAERTRGVTLEEVSGGYQLRSKVDNANYLKKMNKVRPFRLSGPALEVMSIIAYKQPIVKSEVDQIRGVESGHLVRALMEKGLVCFAGKSELPGKPMQYATTRKFLDIFGLRNLKELPTLSEIEELLPDGIGDEEDNEVLADITEGMSEEQALSYSEGQEELEKIVDQINSIDTSSDFFEEEKRREREKRDRDRAENIREALDLNEEVDEKEVKWLKRYDAKLEQLAAKAAEEEAQSMEAVEGDVSPTDEVSMTDAGEIIEENAEIYADFSKSEESDEQLSDLPEDLSARLSEEGLSVVSIEDAFFDENPAEPENGDSVSSIDMSAQANDAILEDTSEDEIDQFLGLSSDEESESSEHLEDSENVGSEDQEEKLD